MGGGKNKEKGGGNNKTEERRKTGRETGKENYLKKASSRLTQENTVLVFVTWYSLLYGYKGTITT